SAGDGRNARLSFAVPVGGSYRIHAYRQSGSGEYQLAMLDAATTLPGTGGEDFFELRRDQAGQNIEIFLNAPNTGPPTFTIPLDGGLVIQSGPGNDTLKVDFANGNPIPAGGLLFDGGPDSADSLVINADGAPASYRPSGQLSGAGDLAIGEHNLSFLNTEA